MKKFTADIIMAAGITAALLLSGFRGFAAQCESVQDEVLRLHIPANSNSEYDQQLKLRLRDFVLEEYSSRLSCESNVQQAIEQTAELLPQIEQGCNEFLAAEGAPYGAKAELCRMHFNTRVYDNVTLPAGEYTALRITLGSGEGKNWWCVMFPPLCIPAASAEKQTALLPDVLVNSEKTQKAEIKFALFEFFEWLAGGCV